MTETRRHHAARRGGFLLLEVVVAVGLLVLGLAVIGAQLQTALVRSHETDRLARVVFLAESKIAELDTGLIPPEQEIEEDFGPLFPAYAWRLRLEPTEDPELFFVQLEILYEPTRDPEDDFDFDGARVEQVYYTLRAAPRPLDLTNDFGMDADVAEKLNEDLAGLGGGELDVYDLDPGFLGRLDMEEILEILPVLMQALNVEQSAILELVPEEMRPQIEALFAGQEAGAVEELIDGSAGEDFDGARGAGGATGGVRDPGGEALEGTSPSDKDETGARPRPRSRRGAPRAGRGGRRGGREQ